MIIEAKTVEELDSRLSDIYVQCNDIQSYIDVYLKVIRMDDADQDPSGYYRMIQIIESKIEDLAR